MYYPSISGTLPKIKYFWHLTTVADGYYSIRIYSLLRTIAERFFEMPAFKVMYELVDDYERKFRKTFETVDTIADFDAAVVVAGDLAQDIAGLTEGRILAYTVSQRTVYTDVVTTGANRDEGVTFTLRKEDNQNDSIKMNAPINAIFNLDGTVNLTHAAVTAFIANFLTGGDFTFSDGEQADELLRGKLDE